MKEIYVLRHTEKDATGALTDIGKDIAKELGDRLGTFDIIISSPKQRAVETARLISGMTPILDDRAGAIMLTPEETKNTHEQGASHLFGIAGVLFDNEVYRPRVLLKGKELAALIEETYNQLSDHARALIISHDGVMVAAYKVLTHDTSLKAAKTFQPLQGFRVFGNWSIEDIK